MSEVGINYGRKRTTFDAYNYIDSESTTASLSLYFAEKLALELSYTSALGIREEKVVNPLTGTTIVQQSISQLTQVYGADLIWVVLGRGSWFQPYIKGGAAYLKRSQEVNIYGQGVYPLNPDAVLIPSFGAGFKIPITQTIGIKVSIDAWRTPIDSTNTSVTDDIAAKAGITWML